MPYFARFADITDPTHSTLADFLEESERFFIDVIRGDGELGPSKNLGLFDQRMRELASELVGDIKAAFAKIREVLYMISDDSEALRNHGLVGAPQRFKLSAIAHIEKNVLRIGIVKGIKKILDFIDVILRSIIGAINDAHKKHVCAVLSRREVISYHDLMRFDIGMGWLIDEIKRGIELLID
jgi:hypothetical protein